MTESNVTPIETILRRMRADDIPEASLGLWQVRKYDNPILGEFTALHRHTIATLHLELGETVMVDHLLELRKHLEFVLRASGRVLITGLGLGCVVRGCLAKPDVTSIAVIERDSSVLNLVKPHISLDHRLEVIQAEAVEWTKDCGREFDYAWHDLWSDPDKGEDALQVTHAKIMANLRDLVNHQGAWAFPRQYKRIVDDAGMGLKP